MEITPIAWLFIFMFLGTEALQLCCAVFMIEKLGSVIQSALHCVLRNLNGVSPISSFYSERYSSAGGEFKLA